MNKKQKFRIEKHRAAFIARQRETPQIPTDLNAILQRLRIISEWYESARDKERQDEIDLFIARINNQQSKVNSYTSTFRGIAPNRIGGYSSAVQKLVELCRKAEEISYPVGLQIESAKALLKSRIMEAIANGDLPEKNEAVIRLQDRIKQLEHEAGR